VTGVSRRANAAAYRDGSVVDRYLADPYHALRADIAVAELGRRVGARGAAGGCGAAGGAGGRPLVLELAAAGGALGLRLAGRACRVVLSDVERQALPRPGECVSCVAFDAAARFPFRGEVFDGLLMGELIEHLYDPVALVRECHRVLRPGGALVLTTPNLATLQDRLRFLLGRSPRQVDPLHEYLRLHIRPFTAQLLTRLLARGGFVVSAVRSNYVVLDCLPGRQLRLRWPARLFPRLGGSLIVVAVKPAPPG